LSYLGFAIECENPGVNAANLPAAAAGSWKLGDQTINRLGFGAMRLTGSAPFDRGAPSDRERSIRVLRRAVELGVNHIDTAAFYFSRLRSANELINTALYPYPDDLVIVTKVGPGRGRSGEWETPATPGQLRGQVEENLRQLGRDHLDVVNLRLIADRPISELFGALAELRDAGLIRHLGISGVTLDQIAQAQAVAPVVCVQNRYGIEEPDPSADKIVAGCGERGIAFVPYFAIAGQGGQWGPGDAEHDEVLAVARAHDASPAQIRLAWTLHLGAHVLAIPGTGDPGHLAENVAAAALRLSPDEMARLTSVHRNS
jgi:pyridoxine 4-dehydrogenase